MDKSPDWRLNAGGNRENHVVAVPILQPQFGYVTLWFNGTSKAHCLKRLI